MMFELRNVMSKYLLLFLINSSAFFSCSMILWSSLSLASFSYYLLRLLLRLGEYMSRRFFCLYDQRCSLSARQIKRGIYV